MNQYTFRPHNPFTFYVGRFRCLRTSHANRLFGGVLRGRLVGSSPKLKETMLAPTPCLDGCGNPATYMGRCQQHQRPRWQGSNRKQRLPKDWATRRTIVLRRDRGICYLCGEPGADTIDHIIAGDDHNLTNLAPVHDRTSPHCHRYKTSVEAHNAKAGNKAKRKH